MQVTEQVAAERYSLELSDPEVRRIGLYINHLAGLTSELIMGDGNGTWSVITQRLLQFKKEDAELIQRLDERALAYGEECVGRIIEDCQRVTIGAINLLQLARRSANACLYLGMCIQHHRTKSIVPMQTEMVEQPPKTKMH